MCKSAFIRVFKNGRRYGLFGWLEAAELTPPAKHVPHAALHSRPQLAAPLQNNFYPRRSNTINHWVLSLERGISLKASVDWGVKSANLHKGLPHARLPHSLRETGGGGAPMSPDVVRLVSGFCQAGDPALREWEQLTPCEQGAPILLSQRILKKEIADRLNISEETFRTHTAHICQKFHVQLSQRCHRQHCSFGHVQMPKARSSGKSIYPT
jgi:hypothetical protein